MTSLNSIIDRYNRTPYIQRWGILFTLTMSIFLVGSLRTFVLFDLNLALTTILVVVALLSVLTLIVATMRKSKTLTGKINPNHLQPRDRNIARILRVTSLIVVVCLGALSGIVYVTNQVPSYTVVFYLISCVFCSVIYVDISNNLEY